MIEYILFVLGIFLLIKGADYLVEGSSSLAKKLGVPTLVIGLTIVAFGTSIPELVVNVLASIKGSGEVAFGNIIGSSMANLLLILGIAAIITNLKIQRSTIWKEIPFSFLAVLILLIFSSVFLLDNLKINSLLRTEGIILLFFFALFIYYVVGLVKKNKENLEDKKIEVIAHPYWIISLMILGGLVGLYFGGKWTVDGAVSIARTFGLSEFLISATIIAIGTSLPELFTTIVATRKKDIDLAVGNIVGSNIFNVFWILGVTSVIKPIPFPNFISVDLLILLFATLLLFIFMFVGKKHELDRWQGILFLILYISYLAFLIVRG
ncbi:calcium/sodium antiporter [archaeon]|nr:calcium/sodium antiporter [archaeon]PJC45298.1 MAG: sodium:proton exchanger [Candidatus Pacearchaeota archaeon CG_4_9_14_0_2_um_filter_30_8]